jgi:predicted esterase
MKTSTRIVLGMLFAFLASFAVEVSGQSVLNPSDPVVNYDANNPPAQPAHGTIGKWVRTKRLNWNTDSYKAYIYKGRAFRLKFPKTYQHGVADGKVYPMLVFFHGLGEGGQIFDNEYQLYHGCQGFMNNVDNGNFDGFVFAMQTGGQWGITEHNLIRELIEYMASNNKLDRFQVITNGLSAGAQGTWEMLLNHPTYVAAAVPMAGVYASYTQSSVVNKVRFTPIWNTHGELDGNPSPFTAAQVNTAMLNGGANYKSVLYAGLGHNVWSRTWSEPDFYPFLRRAYQSNPWTLFGRTEFCVGDPINITIGLTAGYDAYEWRKSDDGGQTWAALPSTTNTIQVTSLGLYSARIRRGTTWSEWSRVPVNVKIKDPTISPDIQVQGLASKVIPALDGKTSVTLEVPTGYASYRWERVGNSTQLSNTNTLTVSQPGDYRIRVTEFFGCSSEFSAPFTVVSADGGNKPSPAIGLSVSTLSKTSLKIDWADNPTPQFNESNFEVYRSRTAGGPYVLAGITGQDVTTFTDEGLDAKTTYFYTVRAVNGTGAAAASAEASGITDADISAPTAPFNLMISGTSQNSITLSWEPATDDVGVTQYEIYVNGQKSYITEGTSFTVFNLQYKNSYSFYVRAKDLAGNISTPSNQVSGQPIISGLSFKHYTYTGTWNTIQNLANLTPVSTGIMPNVSIAQRAQNDQFAFLWEGYINITTPGTYFFRTTSDDGSMLYLGPKGGTESPYVHGSTPLVNNDGLHGSRSITSAAVTLEVGIYPIAISFYEQSSGETMSVTWRTPLTGTNFVAIPNNVFVESPADNGAAPEAPSNVVAVAQGFNQIGLTWADNSSNESGFEIWRSNEPNGLYEIVGTVGGNVNSYTDRNLQPNSTYYYRVRAIGQFGESDFASNNVTESARWRFNGDLVGTGLFPRTLTQNGNPPFNTTDKQEGTHSISFNGSNQQLNIPTAANDFIRGIHTQRTLMFWMKASATNLSNRILVDLGGSDNGMAVRMNLSTIEAGVASSNNRRAISSTFVPNQWNHVAVVYATNTLKLYVNGALVAENDNLGFTQINATSNGSRIATVDGSTAFNNNPGRYSGLLDHLVIYNAALSAEQIAAVQNDQSFPVSFATTQGLPQAPAAAEALVANALSASKIDVSWNDVADNEEGYDLYRSANNENNFVLLGKLPANTTSYSDTGLFANAVFYYKVKALNAGGESAFSNSDSAKTLNNLPTISALANRSVRFGTTTNLAVSANDPDGGAVTLSAANLPAFASFTDNGNGTGTLTLSPSAAEINQTFSGISISALDGAGGTATTSFDLTVNDNFDPSLAAISNVSINEKDSLSISLSANDQNEGDVISWSVQGAGFATLVNAEGTSNQLVLKPSYADAGTYNLEVTINDGKGGTTTRSFVVTVADKEPTNTKIFVRFRHQTNVAAPWNNITGVNTNNLKDQFNNTTNIGLQFQTSWWSTWNEGPQAPNNSGVYPNDVLKEYYFFGSYPGIFTGPASVDVKITGLNPNGKYDISLLAGSSWGVLWNNGVTTFTVNGNTKSIAVQNNTSNTADFGTVSPAADGSITFSVGKDANTQVGYLNALVITELFDDGTAPAAPSTLSAVNGANGVVVTWNDRAYNETGYEVLRSTTSAEAGFSKIGETNSNAVSFTDNAIAGNQTYFYKVVAVNAYGSSNASPVASVQTPNQAPVISGVVNTSLKNNEVRQVQITTQDDANDVVSLSVSNLPSFVTFVNNGNGTGVLNINPAGTIGNFTGITVTAVDNSGASSTRTMDIAVADKDIKSVYINFTDGVIGAEKPWNNFTAQPWPGATMSNLRDESDNQTNISVSLPDGFQWYIAAGMRPGNGKGIYPEAVMRTSLYEAGNNTRRIRLSGLNTQKRYNVVFFASHDDGIRGTTNFTINGSTVTLNASYNIDKTVQINGVVPNASGQIEVSVSKASGQQFAYVSSIVLQEYDNPSLLLSPSDLIVKDVKHNQVGLQWADRSASETGFEVWRAGSNGTYSLVTTLPANTTSYIQTGLTPNTTYHYRVRAVENGTNSEFSSAATATTYAYSVYVNFTLNNPAPAPWNNTNSNPQLGSVWSNLKAENGNTTTVALTITKNFDGIYGAGQTTGNNSGLFPDKVLIDNYGLFPGQSATIKFYNLNMSMKYDFTFMGSSVEQGDLNTLYTINGKSALLNGSLNTFGTVSLTGISPNDQGEISIDIAPGTPTSLYGLLAGMIIQGHNVPASNEVPPVPETLGLDAVGGTNKVVVAAVAETKIAESTVVGLPAEMIQAPKAMAVYPNPFDTRFNITLEAKRGDKVQIDIFDLSGKLMYRNVFGNLNEGNNVLEIQTGGKVMKSGYYIVKATSLQSNTKYQSFRVFRK